MTATPDRPNEDDLSREAFLRMMNPHWKDAEVANALAVPDSARDQEMYPVEDATDPRYGMHVGATSLVNVHHPSKCQGRGCSIHHPSDHHMVKWPKVWRADKGFFERACRHGIGHPDPDDAAYMESKGDDWATVHGCDGCCIKK
jgi:hypothetical protein